MQMLSGKLDETIGGNCANITMECIQKLYQFMLKRIRECSRKKRYQTHY